VFQVALDACLMMATRQDETWPDRVLLPPFPLLPLTLQINCA